MTESEREHLRIILDAGVEKIARCKKWQMRASKLAAALYAYCPAHCPSKRGRTCDKNHCAGILARDALEAYRKDSE